ncbi:MAG: adenylyl-sulfate kinase [Actinobacteria bacterium]|nr:adenylyl-sulfate kinase [Actinomycetota bacterium]
MTYSDLVWHASLVDRKLRPSAGGTVWFTGLSGSGKSTLATAVESALIKAGRHAYILDGDNLRHGLNADLGFTAEDRKENVRRVAHVARLFADAGVVALVPVISPYRSARAEARATHQALGLAFVEVFVDAPLQDCIDRDPKGLYAKAIEGTIAHFTGISDPYEEPEEPEVHIKTKEQSPEESVSRILAYLESVDLLASSQALLDAEAQVKQPRA